uniref:Secreted protein n=1 Tax=Achlya hypogyna TaxID=1202772 RepID=A0A0A7CN31_ACHHY|nr:secreted protein [Achlya hypogyna]
MRVIITTALLGFTAAETFTASTTGPAGGNPVFGASCGLMAGIPSTPAYQVSLNYAQYGQGQNCGRCVAVTCVDDRCKGKPTVVAQITDSGSSNSGDLLLSEQLFKKVTGATTDWYKVSWQFADCPVTGGVTVCAKSGSSPWWLAVQPTNTLGGVQSMTINGKPATYMSDINNYYFKADSTAATPLETTAITLTSFQGETISTLVSLTAGQCTQTNVQFQHVAQPTTVHVPVTSTPPPSTSAPPPSTSTPTSAPRACGIPEWNTDYPGNDISNFGATGDFISMLSQCCDACKDTANCAAYTLANDFCYLKSAGANSKPVNGATSVLMAGVPVPTTVPTPTTTSPAPTTSAPAPRTCANPEWNTDYPGNDISNFGATGDFNSMLAQCCKACGATGNCAVYTLANGVCYLKSAGGNSKPLNGATSVFMNAKCGATEADVDYYGNDVSRFGVSGDISSQLTVCCSACAVEPRCAGFTVNGGACNLKSVLTNRIPVKGAISALRQ